MHTSDSTRTPPHTRGHVRDLSQFSFGLSQGPFDTDVGSSLCTISTDLGEDTVVMHKCNYLTIMRYASRMEMALYAFAALMAVGQGAAMPMFSLVVGKMANNFNRLVVGPFLTPKEFMDLVSHNTLYFIYIGIGIAATASLQALLFVRLGERVAARIRKRYVSAVIHQNIAFFDTVTPGEITARITNDTCTIQAGISDKVGVVIGGFSTFVVSMVIAFKYQWKLACILLSSVAFIIINLLIGFYFVDKYTRKADNVFNIGCGIAEESLRAFKTTVAFGLQKRLVAQFDKTLKYSVHMKIKSSIAWSILLALLWAAIFWTYSLAFWMGSRILANFECTIGDILVVLTSTLVGAFQLGSVAPEMRYISSAISAMSQIHATIQRKPVIDSTSPTGGTINNLQGEIEFQSVNFSYPSQPDVKILENFNLRLPRGKTVAFIGASGSGKTTLIGILERYYRISGGRVTLDGVDLESLNIRWLREQIGYVPQEPTLFTGTVFENVAQGLHGTQWQDASIAIKHQMVEDVCKEVNAWEFIENLSNGLFTDVGEKGSLLSGGQRQRIAIARAIVKKPKIMLLDEATSALDTLSEGIVQCALEKASENRTTIVIAHRLSTIQNADLIVLMQKGSIIEMGTHEELMTQSGEYQTLVELQQVRNRYSTLSLNPTKSQPWETQLHRYSVATLKNCSETLGSSDEENEKYSKSCNSISNKSQEKWSYSKSAKFVFNVNRRMVGLLMLGLTAAVLLGYGFPAMAMVVGKMISAIMVPPDRYGSMKLRINKLAAAIFGIGWSQVLLGLVMVYSLCVYDSELVANARRKLLRQYLRMDVEYWDEAGHSPGALVSILAKDAESILGVGGYMDGQVIRCVAILLGGVITCIPFNWKLGLVGTCAIPILFWCGITRIRIIGSHQEYSRKCNEESGSIASQYVAGVRTVQALTLEERVCDYYSNVIENQLNASLWSGVYSAFMYGISEGIGPFIQALIFWYGGHLLSKGQATITAYFTVYIGLVIGVQTAAYLFTCSTHAAQGKSAALGVKRVLTEKPTIDSESPDGLILGPLGICKSLEFKGVWFNYPSQPTKQVLRGLNLKIEKGSFTALVGPSGCGKSTIIGMIERFYDPDSGSILVDGKELSSLNIQGWRERIAYVQQEPALFPGTIRENILFGWPGEADEVDMSAVEDAARQANIHDFIMSLSHGYETPIGAQGFTLSGGQRQRLAIARALIRQPTLLLLDEATSALDSESERLVQEVLEKAARKRTTIAIAHRLSSIQNADVIYFVDQGQIIESGTHRQLMSLRGRYAELARLQSLGYEAA